MQNLLLFNSDQRPFDFDAVNRIVQSENGFRDVCFDEPGGALMEAVYAEDQDFIIVRLSRNGNRISLSGTTDAALRVALILQRHLQSPLRIIDWDYSFDL